MQVNLYSLWDRVKSGIYEVVKSRVFVAVIIFCVLSAILLQRVFYLQIVKGQSFADEYKLQIQKTKEIQGTRGKIYDRNGNLLAYNELAYSVTIEDNWEDSADKNKEINKVINTVHLHRDFLIYWYLTSNNGITKHAVIFRDGCV